MRLHFFTLVNIDIRKKNDIKIMMAVSSDISLMSSTDLHFNKV